jgi:hypothetical protein
MKSEFYIGDLFNVSSGKTKNLYKLSRGTTPFVTATDKNNGISAYIDDVPTFEKNLITVSRNGSVCEAFFQPMPFCASLDDIRVLQPIGFKLDTYTGLFICVLIRREKFRYNYGRKFGSDRIRKTKIVLPTKGKKEVDWDLIRKLAKDYLNKTSQTAIDIFNGKYSTKPLGKQNIELDPSKWSYFPISKIFDIKKGKRLTKEDMDAGKTPFIAAIDSNNGWRDFIGQMPLHSGNTISVNYNGSVAEAFYQPIPYCASDDVNVLYPKFEMNIFNALFIAAVIRHEKYRFNYGRKWHVDRMANSKIKLPAIKGKPDVLFMENYIKSLPYSASLEDREGKIKKPKVQNIKLTKGLSDDELIEKYESGKAPMKLFMKGLLKTPLPAAKKSKKG